MTLVMTWLGIGCLLAITSLSIILFAHIREGRPLDEIEAIAALGSLFLWPAYLWVLVGDHMRKGSDP